MSMDTAESKDKFSRLYASYRYTMLHVAMSILKNQSDAEDAVHDSFLKVIQILDQIGEVECSKTKSLIVIIVKNKSIDRYRREKRLAQAPIEDYENVLPDESEPFEVFADRQDYLRLLGAIGSLSDSYRTVLELKYLHGYSNGEIASLLDIELKNVNMRLYRAKGKLREILEKEETPCG